MAINEPLKKKNQKMQNAMQKKLKLKLAYSCLQNISTKIRIEI